MAHIRCSVLVAAGGRLLTMRPPPAPHLLLGRRGVAGAGRRDPTLGSNGTIIAEPRREHRYGLWKVFLTVTSGLLIGASIRQELDKVVDWVMER